MARVTSYCIFHFMMVGFIWQGNWPVAFMALIAPMVLRRCYND